MKTLNPKELRELDAWIAEWVFGFKWTKLDRRGKTNHLFPSDFFKFAPDPENFNDIGGSPYYTTDPAAAMEVLKKCAAKANEVEPSSFVSVGCYHTVFQVILIWHNGATTKFNSESQAETLELAICLFAKKLFAK